MTTPLSLEEQAADLGRKLASFYGETVAVEYVDIFSPEMTEHRAAFELLSTRNLPLPLIASDEEPRFAGGISLEVISRALEDDGLVTPAELAKAGGSE